jgi:CheY-like chemotaxis protein
MPPHPRPGTIAARLTATTTIAVVEDEHDIAGFVAAYLHAVGYHVVHIDAPSLDEAHAEILGARPALVVLDLHLRSFTGLDVYRRMRADTVLARTPVVVLSADQRETTRSYTRRLGIDTYLGKPFDPRQLHSIIEDALLPADDDPRDYLHEPTGCFTHDYALDRLADEIELARRGGGAVGFALVRASGGDRAMRAAVRGLTASTPPGSVVAVGDGGELSVVVPGDDTATLVGRLRRSHRLVDAEMVIGCASFPADAADADALFMAADVALADAALGGATVRGAS